MGRFVLLQQILRSIAKASQTELLGKAGFHSVKILQRALWLHKNRVTFLGDISFSLPVSLIPRPLRHSIPQALDRFDLQFFALCSCPPLLTSSSR